MAARTREQLAPALITALEDVEDAAQRFGTRLRDGLGVNTVDCAVLRWIDRVDRRGGAVRVGDIADHFGVSSGSATEIAHRLGRAGLLERAAHPTDARIRRLVPTALARQRLDALAGAVRDHLDELLGTITVEEEQRIVQLLRSVCEIYDGDDED